MMYGTVAQQDKWPECPETTPVIRPPLFLSPADITGWTWPHLKSYENEYPHTDTHKKKNTVVQRLVWGAWKKEMVARTGVVNL